MSLTECTVETNNVQKLPDSPTQSAQELKKVFDKVGEDIKKYINETLIPDIEEEDDKVEENIKK